jgi:hypothetical protein
MKEPEEPVRLNCIESDSHARQGETQNPSQPITIPDE